MPSFATPDLRHGRTSRQATPPHVADAIRTGIVRSMAGMAIARFPSIVIDCLDPGVLARFYGAMLDWKVDVSSGWAEVRAEYDQCICFSRWTGTRRRCGQRRSCPSRCTST